MMYKQPIRCNNNNKNMKQNVKIAVFVNAKANVGSFCQFDPHAFRTLCCYIFNLVTLELG